MGHRFSFLKLRIFADLRKRILGKYAQGVIYNTANGLLAAPIDDVSVGKSLGFKGAYDTPEISTLQDLLTKDDVVYVIGTHIGALLIPLAKKSKEIIGYEANPETFEYLKTNVHLNTLTNTRLFNLAVGDTSCKIEFYQNRMNSGGSKMKPRKDSYLYNYDSPKTIEVSMISLDNHIELENLPEPQGIIMDIEGAEFFALKGMQESLKKSRFLYIEYIPHHLENVAGVSNKDFFNLITPHFNYVKLMRHRSEVMDIRTSPDQLLMIADDFREKGNSDDFLFMKALPR